MSNRPPSIERRLLDYEPSARRLLRLGVAASFAATMLVLVLALLLSDIVAGVIVEQRAFGEVAPVLLLMLAIAVARAGLALAGDCLVQSAATRLKTAIRDDLAKHLLQLGPLYSSRERSGELAHTYVQGLEDLDEYVAAFVPLRWLAVLVPVAVLGFVLVIDPFTVIILLLTGPLLVLFLVLIGSRARNATEQRFREMSWTSAHLLDMLQGLPTLKLFGRSREQAQSVRSLSKRNGDLTMEVLRTTFETSFVLEMCSALAVALVAVEVSLRLVEGALPFEQALVVLMITPEFFQPLRLLSVRYHARASGSAAAERAFEILDTPAGATPAASPTAAPGQRGDGIRFERVSFSYDARGPALTSVSLSIPEGTTAALIGETGAGKTTVANLLLGFALPSGGAITFGGKALDTGGIAAWRERVAWVPQRPYLFHGTVRDNIRLARPHASMHEVAEAARAAHAHDFITSLPHGYDTEIGERGARLSGGEQQRLAIARAFLKDAPVLVIDEATSHLDEYTEAQVEAALRRLLAGRTALIIAHRERLLQLAGRVYVLSRGRIVRDGATDEVLAAGNGHRNVLTHPQDALP